MTNTVTQSVGIGMHPIRHVFLSSTTRDLAAYRKVAREVIEAVNDTFSRRFTLKQESMDGQGQDGDATTPLEVSRAWVRDSDWVVLIVAWNYGYVPPGEACSVTESEYREAIKQGKKCFVFLAGELSDPPAFRFRALSYEQDNLTDYRGAIETRAHEPALQAFKDALRSQRFALFRDIEDFRVKLTQTLTQRIIKDLFATLGPEIVALGLQRPLQACIREVKLLARLKRIHDTLHRIRQFGIRSWREELLASWPEESHPPLEARYKYVEGAVEIQSLIALVSALVPELPDEVKRALPPLDKVTGYKVTDNIKNGRANFIQASEEFASRVQRLFTGCDAQMAHSARRLAQHYNSLAESTRNALDRRQVLPQREELLRAEHARSVHIHKRLQSVLHNHREWQMVHDQLERIDNTLDPGQATDDEQKCEASNAALQREAFNLVDSRGAEVHALLAMATDIVTQDSSERLNHWPRLILAVGVHLNAFISTPQVSHYEAMRKSFDDLFFQIDLETLRAVEISEGNVRAIDAGLNGKDDISNTGAGGL